MRLSPVPLRRRGPRVDAPTCVRCMYPWPGRRVMSRVSFENPNRAQKASFASPEALAMWSVPRRHTADGFCLARDRRRTLSTLLSCQFEASPALGQRDRFSPVSPGFLSAPSGVLPSFCLPRTSPLTQLCQSPLALQSLGFSFSSSPLATGPEAVRLLAPSPSIVRLSRFPLSTLCHSTAFLLSPSSKAAPSVRSSFSPPASPVHASAPSSSSPHPAASLHPSSSPSPSSSSPSPSSSSASSSSNSDSSEGSLRVLWRLMEHEQLRLFLVLLAILLSSAAQMLFPLYLGRVVDRFSKQSPVSAPSPSSMLAASSCGDLSPAPSPSSSSSSSSGASSPHPPAQREAAAHPNVGEDAEERGQCGTETRAGGDAEEAKKTTPSSVAPRPASPQQALLLGSISAVDNGALICGALLFLGAATSFLRLLLLETTIERIAARLRLKYFSHLLGEPTTRFSLESSGVLLNRLSTEVTQTSRILIDLSFGIRCAISAFVGVVAASSLAPTSFLLSLLLPTAAVGFLLRATAKCSRRLQRAQTHALSSTLADAAQILQNRKSVRTLNAEALELSKFNAGLEGVYKVARRSAVAVGARHGLVFALGGGFLLHVIQRAGSFISAGALSLGDVTALAMYCVMAGSSLQGCVTAYGDVHRTLGTAGNVLSALAQSASEEKRPGGVATKAAFKPCLSPLFASSNSSSPASSPSSSSGSVSPSSGWGLGRTPGCGRARGMDVTFKNVHFAYPDRLAQPVLRGVDLHVPSGAFLGILGPSGSGKSTLAALLLRLYEPEEGEIQFNNTPIGSLDSQFVRSLISPVTQENLLLAKSVRENVEYSVHADDLLNATQTSPAELARRVDAACRLAAVSEFVSQLPEQLETLLDEDALSLSGGQRQRICLARALCRLAPSSPASASSRELPSASLCGEETRGPSLLLLDEATSALDVPTERQVLGHVTQALEGRTAIFITHRLSVLDFVDHVAVMSEGRVVQSGEKAAVLAAPCSELRHILDCNASCN
ncbi:ABC transporter transmembrane region domain-containing protein [Toxoplasma gondii GT1]|uniref:ABC transporter transmembrane region domain-containing protein n=6 Tax=Toxoplasma gondii TaxID=5811 RepID=S7WDN9_TOXGG|nr:ABC transporter transmembrane region domain-containing protein [Toxoplasma gondii GT1]KAF4640917.1 ABC transporter transmembrane region domain-containing protein [Toxoplasma gondii]